MAHIRSDCIDGYIEGERVGPRSTPAPRFVADGWVEGEFLPQPHSPHRSATVTMPAYGTPGVYYMEGELPPTSQRHRNFGEPGVYYLEGDMPGVYK